MNTTHTLPFPMLKDEALRHQLQHLIQNFTIQQVFYHPSHNEQPAHVLIHTSNPHEAESFAKQKWVKKIHAKGEVLLHFAATGRLQYRTKMGNPFLPYYYKSAAIIYQNPDYDHELYFQIEEQSFLKKLRRYTNTFHHDYDLLTAEARRQQNSGAEVGVYLTYHSIFSVLLDQLESLYIGPFIAEHNLNERIANLTRYLPELQSLLVKKSEKNYFLIQCLEAATAPNAANEDLYLNTDLLPALQKTTEALYILVEQRFKTMKKGLHFPYIGGVTGEKPSLKEALLGQAIHIMTKIATPEEIYLFHTKETEEVPDKNPHHLLFYVLLIGKGIGTEKLTAIQQSVSDVTQKQCTLIAIAHSRYFIQDNLYALQTFFKGIVQPENRIYTSDSLHPMLHWQDSHTTYYGDLGIFKPRAQRYVEQFQTLITTRQEAHPEAVFIVFAHAFTHALRTYLYLNLFSYQPNQLPTYSLWKLAVYGNPNLEKIEFLFDKLGNNFYKDIDTHLRFVDRPNRIADEKVRVMEQILKVVMEEIGED